MKKYFFTALHNTYQIAPSGLIWSPMSILVVWATTMQDAIDSVNFVLGEKWAKCYNEEEMKDVLDYNNQTIDASWPGGSIKLEEFI